MKKVKYLILVLLILSCREQALMPKPDGYFRIEFNKPNYNKFKKTDSKITFYLNKNETTEIDSTNNVLKVSYLRLNMDLILNFNSLSKADNIKRNLDDFYNIVQTHAKKSNTLSIKDYENEQHKVYGRLYEFKGNVATPLQFFLTDSTTNFVRGHLQPKSKIVYDSIYPSIQYIKNDVLVLFESLQWDGKN